MSGRWNQRSQSTRFLLYAVATILAFVLAASVGVVAALVVNGDLNRPTGDGARPEESTLAGEPGKPAPHQQADVDRSQRGKTDTQREQAGSRNERATYVHGIGEIQAKSVEAFLDSHEKLLHYDALTSGDVHRMQANRDALQGFVEQAGDLKVPRKYAQQKDAFLSAIDDLHQAAQLAYALAADPLSADQTDFDHYDSLVEEAAANLQRSNKILGEHFETVEGLQEVSAS